MFYFMYMFEPKEQNANPNFTQWNFTKANAQLSLNNILLVE